MSNEISRRTLVKSLLDARPDDLAVVAGLGSSCWDVSAAGDHPKNMYIWGAMGGAAMIGYGVAHAQKNRRVLVITGDGEMLMGMGAFSTIAWRPIPNLAILVLDNGRFGETGAQPTHTSGPADLGAIAQASGIEKVRTITNPNETEALKSFLFEEPGPVVAVAKIKYEKLKFVLPSSSGSYLKDRFRVEMMGIDQATLP
jgi:thiamine pyrophosphate-dependent acetolactate synthase large subunit-like protein